MIYALESTFKTWQFIMKMIRSYIQDCELIYETQGNLCKKKITSGAAQGYILGPELYNISYDEILKIDMPPDTYLAGYADDISAVIAGRDIEEIQRKLNQVMIRSKAWLDDHYLKLAIITRRHMPLTVEMQVLTEEIHTELYIKYLGFKLDCRLNFTAQLQHSAQKASQATAYLSRLMANIGRPTQTKEDF